MSCPLCSPSTLEIARSQYWTMVLNEDQGYLGRCYFKLNRHETDVTRLTDGELSSLWGFFRRAKSALDRAWQPDHYNYVFLTNVQPHLHGHIIPRYSASRTAAGITFTDGRLGQHYDLDNVRIPTEMALTAIRDELQASMPQDGSCQ